jgi:putative lipoic acid-binding regulatory protein
VEPNSNPDEPRSGDILESAHSFPGRYKIKAIGRASEDFEPRLMSAVRACLGPEADLEHSARTTPGGRHVAITLEITAQSAEQVRELYAEIHKVEGLTLLI